MFRINRRNNPFSDYPPLDFGIFLQPHIRRAGHQLRSAAAISERNIRFRCN
jgi:hypothetical protein